MQLNGSCTSRSAISQILERNMTTKWLCLQQHQSNAQSWSTKQIKTSPFSLELLYFLHLGNIFSRNVPVAFTIAYDCPLRLQLPTIAWSTSSALELENKMQALQPFPRPPVPALASYLPAVDQHGLKSAPCSIRWFPPSPKTPLSLLPYLLHSVAWETWVPRRSFASPFTKTKVCESSKKAQLVLLKGILLMFQGPWSYVR